MRVAAGGAAAALGSRRAWASTNARTQRRATRAAGHCITPGDEPHRLVERLAELVSFDTQNPDGDERPLVRRLGAELRALGAATVDEVDVGDHAYVYARFGAGIAARAAQRARRHGPRQRAATRRRPTCSCAAATGCYGLGTADTKGAIAAILEALAAGPVTRPVGVLFSGDEEQRRQLHPGVPGQRGRARAGTGDRLRAHAAAGLGARHRGIGAATVTLEAAGRAIRRASTIC